MQMTARIAATFALHRWVYHKYLILLINLIFFALAACGLLLSATAQAQVARVLDTKGTALVERSGQVPRLLGAGEQLGERDVINVARDSWAILEFNDQTRITLRPNTVFRLDSYRADAPETMLLGLVKGGLRVVTGLFGKRNPQGVKFQTAVATIGIRGTEFDARLCDADCAAEERARPVPRPLVLPVARVVEMDGAVAAGRVGEPVRLLVPGSMLHEGDAIVTGPKGSAVLAFRDQSRITLGNSSRLALLQFRFEDGPRTGSAVIRHLSGFARVESGLIAKQGPAYYRFIAPIGEIRPHGSMWDSVVNVVQSGGQSAEEKRRQAEEEARRLANEAANAAANAAGSSTSPETRTVVTTVANTAGQTAVDQFNQLVTTVQNTVNEVVATVATQGQNVQQQANNVGVAVQNQVQNTGQAVSDALVTQAVNALNAATTPIVNAMTALLTQMRNNPPQTEAAVRQIELQVRGLRDQMSATLSQATASAGNAVNSDSFKTAVGIYWVGLLDFHGTSTRALDSIPGYGIATTGSKLYFFELLEVIRDSPYLSESVERVGISRGDLDRMLDAPFALRATAAIYNSHHILQTEFGEYVAGSGSVAIGALANEARAVTAAAQQRAEQEAARVAAEAARKAAEAARLAAEAKAAADAKLAAERKVAEEKAAADKQRAAEKLAQAKILAEAQARAAEQQAVNAAVAALRAATDPIVSQITALMAQMRNNPPSTEAAFRKSEALMNQLIVQLNAAQEQFMIAHRDLVFSAPVQRVFALSDAATLSLYGFMQMYSLRAYVQQAEQAGVDGGRISSVISGIDPVDYELKRRELALSLVSLAERRAGMESIGLSLGELVGIAWIGGTSIDGSAVVSLVQSNVSQAAAAEGDAAFAAFFAEAQAGALVAQQRAEQQAAAARAAADAAKAAADAKLAAARKAAEDKAAADKQLAAQKLAAAKQQLEAGVQGQIDGIRSYDITGGTIAVVGPPDTVVPPGILRTVPGEPIVTRMGDQVVTTWVETVIGGEVRTAFGGNATGGTVTRTEVSGPGGMTTTLVFNVMFVDPMITVLVPHVGGPLVSLGLGKPGNVQVTHRAPDGTTNVSYPGNKDDPRNSTVTVLDGEVEVIGRGRVQKGEMLASTGDKVRLAGLAAVPDIKVDPDPFKSSDKAVEEGLYVWVRDGAVQVAKDDKSVDVPAGSAAVATKDKVELLDVVPNFLRFDPTPRPAPGGGATVIDTFRASDGAILNMCAIR